MQGVGGNMKNRVRLCMIGAGRHASRNIYPCFRLLKGMEVVANADLDEERARAAASLNGIPRSYTDYREMLEKEKPGGVIVCVGPDFHAKTAIELMQAGYHVYTEKPPAIDSEQFRQVLAVQRQTGRICMAAFKKRFAPCYVKAKALLEREDFGQPAVLSIVRTSGNYGDGDDPRSWYLLDSAIHVVDLAAWLFGRIEEVHAMRGPASSYAVNLKYANGAVGTLTLTDRMSYRRGWELVTMIGTGGVCAQVDNSVEMTAFHFDQPIAAHKPEFVAGSSNSLVELGFVGELQAFVDAARSGTMPDASAEETGHTMEILSAIRRSMAAGTPSQVTRGWAAKGRPETLERGEESHALPPGRQQ